MDKNLNNVTGQLRYMPDGWKDRLDHAARKDLYEVTKKTITHKHAYSSSDNPGIAQIWMALTEINRSIEDLSRRIDALEGKDHQTTEKEDKSIIDDYDKW